MTRDYRERSLEIVNATLEVGVVVRDLEGLREKLLVYLGSEGEAIDIEEIVRKFSTTLSLLEKAYSKVAKEGYYKDLAWSSRERKEVG